MSTYGTELTLEDDDGDELWVNRCTLGTKPMFLLLDQGHSGIELYREDVVKLATYLVGVVDTVPKKPRRPNDRPATREA